MRQLGVAFKCRHIFPARVNVELIRVTNRLECAVAKAAGLLARRPLYFEHRRVYFASFPGASVKSGEYEYFCGHVSK
jgi:hypothetical protein